MAGISRVELTIQAAVPPEPMEMRAAAQEVVSQLDPQQVELVAWLAANLLEVIEFRAPKAMVYPNLLHEFRATKGAIHRRTGRPLLPLQSE